jgi:hypothetical protein
VIIFIAAKQLLTFIYPFLDGIAFLILFLLIDLNDDFRMLRCNAQDGSISMLLFLLQKGKDILIDMVLIAVDSGFFTCYGFGDVGLKRLRIVTEINWIFFSRECILYF